MNGFTDTHCHIYQEYYEEIEKVFLEAREHNVKRFIVSGCDKKSNKEVVDLVQKDDGVYGTIGFHPEEANNCSFEDLLELEKQIESEKIVGIGEIGLDYHYTKENKLAQKALFERQLEIALKKHLPVVIHSRESTEDTIMILKKFPEVKGIIHSFSGSLETAKIYIKMGYKLGINGVVTFKNSHLKEILKDILPFIVLETDSPYLTPHPYRGSENAPKYVEVIADFICEYLHITKEELLDITNSNIKSVFDI